MKRVLLCLVLLLALASPALADVVHLPLGFGPPVPWVTVTFIDVGQGDAIWRCVALQEVPLTVARCLAPSAVPGNCIDAYQ